MTLLNMTPDELLTTTRSVRKRLDFSRPVEPELLRECLEIAVQAPTGGNRQTWHFILVTDRQKIQALGEIYSKGWVAYRQLQQQTVANLAQSKRMTPDRITTLARVADSANYLAEHMHEVPAMLIPCGYGRAEIDGQPASVQAGWWGSLLPAAWSFMLAARARSLGTCWTSVHLFYEKEAAEVLGIPYEKVVQAAMIPIAHTLGTEFKPGARVPLDDILHWDNW
ncbi:MAG TPA: nitroreductase family protein [Ktedonobacteraceae bacterium]|nr:nitroreductase family protein [Ktedonobacteraceae bacterium]